MKHNDSIAGSDPGCNQAVPPIFKILSDPRHATRVSLAAKKISGFPRGDRSESDPFPAIQALNRGEPIIWHPSTRVGRGSLARWSIDSRTRCMGPGSSRTPLPGQRPAGRAKSVHVRMGPRLRAFTTLPRCLKAQPQEPISIPPIRSTPRRRRRPTFPQPGSGIGTPIPKHRSSMIRAEVGCRVANSRRFRRSAPVDWPDSV